MVIGEPGNTTTRKQAWVGVLVLSASLAAAAWFGTWHQSLAERHAYARCAPSCVRPSSEPLWVFAVLAGLFLLAAAVLALHREQRRR